MRRRQSEIPIILTQSLGRMSLSARFSILFFAGQVCRSDDVGGTLRRGNWRDFPGGLYAWMRPSRERKLSPWVLGVLSCQATRITRNPATLAPRALRLAPKARPVSLALSAHRLRLLTPLPITPLAQFRAKLSGEPSAADTQWYAHNTYLRSTRERGKTCSITIHFRASQRPRVCPGNVVKCSRFLFTGTRDFWGWAFGGIWVWFCGNWDARKGLFNKVNMSRKI